VGVYKGSLYLFSQRGDIGLVLNIAKGKNNLLKSEVQVRKIVIPVLNYIIKHMP
jgi:hypothetical protein